VLDESLLEEFIMYEFGPRVSPYFTILLPEQAQKKIARYVDAFVLPRIAAGRSNNRLDPPVVP
jgi:hypothetical protein